MVYDGNRTPYRTDRALRGFEVHDYAAAISFGLPIEPEDSQYGKSWMEFETGAGKVQSDRKGDAGARKRAAKRQDRRLAWVLNLSLSR